MASNVTVAFDWPWASKSGSGFVSDSRPRTRPEVLSCEANRPRPRRANAAHSSVWFAPPNRAWSAARIALRASTIDGFVGMSRNASNSSWIQRRLPGHCVTGRAPAAHWACRPRSLSGNWALYFAASALRSSKLIATQILSLIHI